MDIENKIEGTLNSLDGMQRAEAPAFFHTRVHARLEKKLLQPFENWMPVRRPAWAIASLAILLAANIFFLSRPSKTVAMDNIETSNIQGFANSYGLSTSSGY